LRNIGQDPETGNIDIDIITTGRPTSKTEKIKTLLSTIRRLDKEIDEITLDVLCEELKGKIEKEEIEEILENLIRSGDVYCPRHDVYKPT
jgi:replicative DNA helicase Mcm